MVMWISAGMWTAQSGRGFSPPAWHTGAFITVYLGFVLLLSDAPFRSRQQQFVLQRVGKRIWAAGQLLYLFLACLVFTLLLWVLTWIFLLPRLEWGWDWGPVLTTVAASGISPEYGVWGLEYECMRNVAPLAATAWVFGMMVGVSFLLGEIMILCNLWLKKGIGLAVVTSFALLPFLVVITANTPYAARKLLWISPLSWLNLSLMGQPNQGLPSYGFAVGGDRWAQRPAGDSDCGNHSPVQFGDGEGVRKWNMPLSYRM